ncbi:hypothetical protein GJ496_009359 [Pomphorhynchus laevis]|nr:hypothetical protein GJ496_009359 [Pomphorhynchus laevis]
MSHKKVYIPTADDKMLENHYISHAEQFHIAVNIKNLRSSLRQQEIIKSLIEMRLRYLDELSRKCKT